MKKLIFSLLLILTITAHADSLSTSAERDIREKLESGLQSTSKDTSHKYAIHKEDLPSLVFESVSLPVLDLPTKAQWDTGPKTVSHFIEISKSAPQKVIFVKQNGKYIGYLTSEKSSYLDQKIGVEIQKIYDIYKPLDVTWVYYNAGSFGKWLTFSVKTVDKQNLTLVDTSGTSPEGYYYQLLPFTKVMERGLGL